MAEARFPDGHSERAAGPLPEVMGFAQGAIERGAESVEIRAGTAPEAKQEAAGAKGGMETATPGRIVHVGVDERNGCVVRRPASVVGTFEQGPGEHVRVNAIVFYDGLNDRGLRLGAYGNQAADSLVGWHTSLPHGTGVGEWCWYWEARAADLEAQAAPSV